jgi:hypothetical protein
MNKHLLVGMLVVILVSFGANAQETKRSATGFGIEAGVGYNTMNLIVIRTNGSDSLVSLNHFWMQPMLRLHYDIMLKQMGLKNNLFLKVFIGYYTFGGKLKPDESGNTKVLSFGSIEGGAGLCFDINHFFQITPMVKGQYIFSGTERFIGSKPTTPRDVKDITKSFSSNLGLQFRVKLKHITIGAEGWLGLTNFRKSEGKSAKENNYRLLIGYEF